MTLNSQHSHPDQDIHKGAIEGDRPNDEQYGNENGMALDAEGMPEDYVAIAQDKIGANVDRTQG